MDNNCISVIIPSYNRKDFIGRAITSVFNQNYDEIEIIIIDDGSTDGTFEYLNEQYKDEKRVKILKNAKNSGAGFSRKAGYQASRGSYLIFMDDDDYYTNFDFFKHAVDVLNSRPNVGMVSSSSVIEYVNDNAFEDSIMNIKGEISGPEYLSKFQQEYMKSNSTFTTIFRKKTLEDANFKDVDMVNDSTIYLRALLAGDAFILDEISGVYRVHSKNITFSLKIKFIIENLIEKKRVYDEIKSRSLLDNPSEWLQKQVLLTAAYFVQYNNVSDDDFNELIAWCADNCEDVASIIIEKLTDIRGRA